jgi:hypothetical protein
MATLVVCETGIAWNNRHRRYGPRAAISRGRQFSTASLRSSYEISLRGTVPTLAELEVVLITNFIQKTNNNTLKRFFIYNHLSFSGLRMQAWNRGLCTTFTNQANN